MEIKTLIESAYKVCDVAMEDGVKEPELRAAILDMFRLLTREPIVNIFVDGAKVAAKTEADKVWVDRHSPL